MKKWLIATPTFILMILTLIGTYFHNDNLLRFGVAGLAGYSFLAIFVTGLTLAFQGVATLSCANRILFGYLLTVLVLTLGISIYFVVHN
ncbi:LasU family protein [Loigolactobacillus bifermentans]|nr:LasU family protein [Loigolactobacillus bifermentans]